MNLSIMENENLYNGYNVNFLKDQFVIDSVELPILNDNLKNDIAVVSDSEEHILNYLNFSLKLSKSRKFPFFTASNIDGILFKKASRSTNWKKDIRVRGYQWGQELYSASHSDFDKGHMTKREDVQWGETPALAQMAANSTFFYTNAVPQHKNLNQQIWKSLEDYILHKETRKRDLKICVFTGPVLSENDPIFVTVVNGVSILIPIIFWKIVYFPKKDGKIYRVGFIMSQNRLLLENGIVEELESTGSQDELFMQFDDAETYQVHISLIEKLTNMQFSKGIDSYQENRNLKLILTEIDIDPDLESDSIEEILGFSLKNIIL